MSREPIDLKESVADVIVKMAEGNPGAVTVMQLLLKAEPDAALFDFLHLDDMNIRGSQIWVGFKDFAGQNISKFVTALRARDEKMIEKINFECAYTGEVAVAGGASSKSRGTRSGCFPGER